VRASVRRASIAVGARRPTIAVFGDPNDAYANRLSCVVRQEAATGGARVISETYTIGQQGFSDLANSLQARHVDGVYFRRLRARGAQTLAGDGRGGCPTVLYYDAVGTVAYALGRLNGAPTRASLRQALAAIGSGSLSPYQGIAGRIDYAALGATPQSGDPVTKALVVLRLDAAFGRTHLDGRLLGRY